MDDRRRPDWAQQLRPISPGLVAEGFSVDRQLRTRALIALIGAGLGSGVATFFLAIFAGFGRWEIGLGLFALIEGPVLWLLWRLDRLRRAVGRYHRAVAAGEPTPGFEPPPGRPSSG